MEIELKMIVGVAGMVTAVCAAIYQVNKVSKIFKNDRKEFKAEMLQEAKENDAKLRHKFEADINALKAKLENLEENVNKDMDHLRETYNGEIRNLGNKIEDLRTELRNQHGQLVGLLSKMIDSRE